MSQRLRNKPRRARGSLGGKLRARRGSWLDIGVPGFWQAREILEPGVRQKPGNSGFMRWRLKGVGRESQEQGSRNEHQGCLETKTTASARQAFICVLPRQNAASGTVCPGLQVGAGWRGDEVRWPGYSYRQGKVLAFSLSLWEGNLSRPLFLDLMQHWRMRVGCTVTTC